ncbi:MAG: hypothetical protein IKG14_04300 [Clostridia bacterium]|nr:hypothetical protein [Clostridia bacterium]
MAKKNGEEEALGVVMFIIFLIGIAAFFLIKWAIIGIVVAIVFLVAWISKISNNNKVKKIINDAYNECKINIPIGHHISIEELRKILELDTTNSEDLFLDRIRDRGERYCIQGKILELNKNGHLYESRIEGTKKYHVSIRFDENENKIESMSCDCPYHLEDNKNCKHIYATLYLIKCKDNIQKIIDGVTDYSNATGKMLEEVNKYIKVNQNKINKDLCNSFIYRSNNYEKLLNTLSNTMQEKKFSELSLLLNFQHLIDTTNDLKECIIEMFDKPLNNIKDGTRRYAESEKAKVSNVKTGIAGAIIANEIFNHFENKKSDVDEELEKEMDDYMLEDWQKDLVRKGEYEPWNFEEDGKLEEDDYYYEDDN